MSFEWIVAVVFVSLAVASTFLRFWLSSRGGNS